ncbi:SpoIIE family protein phosphatase [Streptomyces sp. NPDC088733]|uniref:SpoIIE family protein phosphatase n=1 Tax=Streptomyces sp. NPDC088733 TaxID=3365880 RepID=UPI0037F8A95A
MLTGIAESGGTHGGPALGCLIAVVSVDGRGRVNGWSDEAEAILGYHRDEATGRPVNEFVADGQPGPPPAGRTRQDRPNRTVLRHKAGHGVEANVLVQRAVAEGGPTVWFLSPVSATDAAGRDVGLLEGAWTQSSAAICLWSTELRLLWANAFSYVVFKAGTDEVHGRLPTEIFAPDSQHHALEEAMRQARDTGTARSVLTYEKVPGENRPHEWAIHIDPVRDRHGGVIALCTMARNNSTEFWARQRLSLLDEARRTIGHSLDVERTARELTDLSVPDLADVALVHLLPETLGNDRTGVHGPVETRLVAASGERGPAAQGAGVNGARHGRAAGRTDWRAVERDSLPGRALWERRAVRVDLPHPAVAWPGWGTDLPAGRSGGGAISAPLTARGITLGVVTFLRHELPFDAEDLLLVEELAETTAVCIDHARHFEREHSTALALQQSLLPREPPAQSAVDAAYGYRPADLAAGVGGDWFDVIPLSGARVALVVGDVVGHGVEAAATMGRLRSVVRTLADIDLPPEELLTSLDDIVNRMDREREADASDPEVGASVLYAVYDPVSRRCCVARAAHVAPLLVLPDGTSELLDVPGGPPLGLGGLPFESAEVELPEDCLLVLFTDGVVESRDRDLGAGIARLQECLVDAGGSSPAAVCDDVLAAMLPRRGDDAALLVARPRTLDAADLAQWDVPPDASAVSTVRGMVTERLAAWGLDDRSFTTELIVSELVTNAVRYGKAPIRLRLIRDQALICEVTDASDAAPHMRRARSFDEGGRGLFLVAQLSTSWGSRHVTDGKIIWAEQQLAPAE